MALRLERQDVSCAGFDDPRGTGPVALDDLYITSLTSAGDVPRPDDVGEEQPAEVFALL